MEQPRREQRTSLEIGELSSTFHRAHWMHASLSDPIREDMTSLMRVFKSPPQRAEQPKTRHTIAILTAP